MILVKLVKLWALNLIFKHLDLIVGKSNEIWFDIKKIMRVKSNQSDLSERLSVPVIVTIKIYSKAHRRNNRIEFQ